MPSVDEFSLFLFDFMSTEICGMGAAISVLDILSSDWYSVEYDNFGHTLMKFW